MKKFSLERQNKGKDGGIPAEMNGWMGAFE